jgi:hypothetical protein
MRHHEHDPATGKFVPADTPDELTTHVPPDERAPWKKEWDRIGEAIEREAKLIAHDRSDNGTFDRLTVNAVIHAQVLKRTDPYDPRCTPE